MLQNLYILFRKNDGFLDVQAIHAMRTNAPTNAQLCMDEILKKLINWWSTLVQIHIHYFQKIM